MVYLFEGKQPNENSPAILLVHKALQALGADIDLRALQRHGAGIWQGECLSLSIGVAVTLFSDKVTGVELLTEGELNNVKTVSHKN